MVTQNAIDIAKGIVKQFEGLSLKPYSCSAKKKTIGYGHVITTEELKLVGDKITSEQADKFLENDIGIAAKALDFCVVELTDNQQAALISFVFNCGTEAFKNSTLLQKLNNREYEAAANQFLRWTKVSGFVVKGLVRRREFERKVFLTK